jgi:hypothetical protein
MKNLISANELRVGNLYDDNGQFKKASPSTIEEVWNAPRSWCKAIPLTEEWLLKFGLKQQGNRKMWTKDRVCVVLEAYTDLSGKPTPEAFYIGFKDLGNVLFHTTLKVEYVHTLQNAFALTGEELTIKQQES